MNSYDVAIAYRIYPRVAESARGFPFSDDKLALAELCLASFKQSLGGLRAKMWVILDSCPDAYAALFRKYFDGDELVLIPLENAGNQATFAKQLEILTTQADSDFVYFAEDDYLYLSGEFHRMIEFLRAHNDVDFVSPYDHLDCYTMDLHRQPKWLRVYTGRHWRTANSTCLTFLSRRQTLRQTRSAFLNYRRRSLDCSLWLSLTKHRVFNPLFFFRNLSREPLSSKIVVKSWLYCWRQILFNPKRTLWIPVPGIATHLDCKALSPNVDWRALALEVFRQRLEPAEEAVCRATPLSVVHGDDR
jgi:hypothetical protein